MLPTPPASDHSLTELLQRYLRGDASAAESLFREIFPTLRHLAVRQLDRERYTAPVSPTELINELWLRNLRNGGWTVNNRQHFYAIASIAIRHVLIDLARARLAQSRGSGGIPAPLPDSMPADLSGTENLQRIVEIGQLMERLEKRDPVAARIVDMRYFAGYTLEEVAELTQLEVRNVRYRWKKAMTWLKEHMGN